MSLDDAAETALVGALLLRPGQVDDVRAWLQTEDIYGTAPQQAYAAMVELRERDEEVSPQSVDTEVREVVALGTQAADAAYLVTAMQATPCDTQGRRLRSDGPGALDPTSRRGGRRPPPPGR